MLSIIQKKGAPMTLCGRLIAYARILPGPAPAGGFPWDEMVHNGLLVVSGEFQSQATLGDFLRNEVKDGSSEGFEGLVAKLREMGEDLPEDLTPDELRRRIDEMSHMEIIPVPAKVVTFESEEAILKMDADIFYVGEFVGVQHAHLAVTSFPILYQAVYREQVSHQTQNEINSILDSVLIGQATSGDPVVLQLEGNVAEFKGDLLDLLLGHIVPNLVYNLTNPTEFSLSWSNFTSFMANYRFPADLKEISDALAKLKDGEHRQNRHLELLCRKIAALQLEQFERLPAIQAELLTYR